MSDCLVLNQNFTAVQIAPWQNALSLLYQGHAQAVDENYQTYDFEDWCELSRLMTENPSGFKCTATLKIAVPDVIRLTRYERMRKTDVKFTRRNIYEHYGNRCCYCGNRFPTRELNLDHVMPRSRGGTTDWNNIVLSCIPCNMRKSNRTPQEAHMRLLVTPTRPKWKGASQMIMKMPVKIKRSWQRFIDQAYWDDQLVP